MATASTEGATAPVGILDAARMLLATWVGLIKTRVEIISTELEEERDRLEEMFFLAVASMFCLSLGVVLLTLLIVLLFWENYRLAVLGGFSALYILAGLGAVWLLRKKAKIKPRLFNTTMDELAKDHEKLKVKADEKQS